MRVVATVDGSCARRRMFAGIVVRDAADGRILCLERRYLGFGTSNQAEYLAVILACRTLHELYAGSLEQADIFTDSMLAFQQLRGSYAVKNAKLRKLHKRAKNWLSFRLQMPVYLNWHSREDADGPIADQLASPKYKEIMDACDHRVVKRGTGGDDPRKARKCGVRATRRGERAPVEDKTKTARCHPGAAS